MPLNRKILSVGAGCTLGVAVLLPASGLAQSPSMAVQGAMMAGGMHAAASACGDYTDEQLRDMKQKQKSQATAAGVSAAQFEAAFQASYDDARSKFASATPVQKEQACQQLRAMAGMM